MIQTQMIDGRIRHYSDAKMKILQVETNVLYDDAIDVMPCQYTYQETNIHVSAPDPPPEFEDSARYLLDEDYVLLPEVTEPDYFNEREPEPNYFE